MCPLELLSRVIRLVFGRGIVKGTDFVRVPINVDLYDHETLIDETVNWKPMVAGGQDHSMSSELGNTARRTSGTPDQDKPKILSECQTKTCIACRCEITRNTVYRLCTQTGSVRFNLIAL